MHVTIQLFRSVVPMWDLLWTVPGGLGGREDAALYHAGRNESLVVCLLDLLRGLSSCATAGIVLGVLCVLCTWAPGTYPESGAANKHGWDMLLPWAKHGRIWESTRRVNALLRMHSFCSKSAVNLAVSPQQEECPAVEQLLP